MSRPARQLRIPVLLAATASVALASLGLLLGAGAVLAAVVLEAGVTPPMTHRTCGPGATAYTDELCVERHQWSGWLADGDDQLWIVPMQDGQDVGSFTSLSYPFPDDAEHFDVRIRPDSVVVRGEDGAEVHYPARMYTPR